MTCRDAPHGHPLGWRVAAATLASLVILAGGSVLAGGGTGWLSSTAGHHELPVTVLTGPSTWNDPDGLEAHAVAFIDSARTSLHAALYELSLPSLAVALARARLRGVDVRLHLESDNRTTRRERDCLSVVAGAAIPVTWDNRPTLMHNKFMIADQAIVWTGSANLTWTGCHLHYNEALLIDSVAVAARYETAFRTLAAGNVPETAASPLIPVGSARIRVGFSTGAARLGLFLEAIQMARRRLQIAAFSLTHPVLVEALARRARDGLPVDILLDYREARGRAARLAEALLAHAGCAIRVGSRVPHPDLLLRFDLPRGQDVKVHYKLLCADDHLVVTGSANLSRNGFEHNDENVVWCDSEAVAQEYQAAMQNLFAATVPFDAPDPDVPP